MTDNEAEYNSLRSENALSAGLRVEIDLSALIAQALHAGDTARHPLYERMEQAAIEEFRERGIQHARFVDICGRAGLSKATGYRLFPGGVESLLQYLHIRTLLTVVRGIRERTGRLGPEVLFEEAVDAGLRGVVQALRRAPLTAKVLRPSRDLMTGYLLSSEPGGILNVLSDYTARCAVIFGSNEPDVKRHSRGLVWSVFGELIADFPTEGDERPWPEPDSPQMQGILEGPVRAFVARVKLRNDETRNELAVPTASLPDPSGLGVPLLVLSVR